MGKTVNSTYTVTRNGIAQSTPLPKLPYGKLVAMQVALAGALVSLCLPGVQQVAYEANPAGKKPKKAGGAENISLELTNDHGGGGASEFRIEYRGVSAEGAAMVEAAVLQAVGAALS